MTQYCRNMQECDNLLINCTLVGHSTKQNHVLIFIKLVKKYLLSGLYKDVRMIFKMERLRSVWE